MSKFMGLHLLKKMTIILLCSGLVISCSAPPRKEKPLSAIDLAELGLTHEEKQNSVDRPIVELALEEKKQEKQVDQIGSLPTVITLSPSSPIVELDKALSDDAPIELSFEQMELRSILEVIGDALDITMVVDPSIGDKVSIRTADKKPLRKKDLWPLLQLLISDAGVTVERKGKVYHFKKVGQDLPSTIGTIGDVLGRKDVPEIMQITPLRYINVESATSILQPLLQQQGRIISLPTLNIIGISTSPERLERVNKLLQVVDADPFLHRGIRLFRLQNSKSAEVKAELDQILQAIAGATPTYSVIALERINSLVVVAPPRSGFKELETWVEILDSRRDDSREQIFIYNVRNLEAKDLATTLTDVFKREDKDEELPKKEDKKLQPFISEQEEVEIEFEVPTPQAQGTAISAEISVNIVADESTNSLLIRATPRDYRQLLETIRILDRVPKEVMVNVVIAEVELTDSTQYGINWTALFDNAVKNTDGEVTGNFFSTIASPDIGNSGLTLNYFSGDLLGILKLVSTDNKVSLLSRPSILVRNNEKARINVGASEPYLSTIERSNTTTYNTQSVNYKETGITLEVTPRINDDGIINMEIMQEVSKLGTPRTDQQLQSFVQRKIETLVVVRDGNPIVIGGLIETDDKDNQTGVPGLKDVPVVGETLFSSTDLSYKRTELVLIIVPRIVDPEKDNRPLVRLFRERMQSVSELLNEQLLLLEGLDIRNKPVRKIVE